MQTSSIRSMKLFNVYVGIIKRCNDQNDRNYNRYGNRGIYIADEWLDYKKFEKWAFDNGYEEGLSIDRIDNNGPYAPWNCRCTDQEMQNNNKENNLFITYRSHRFSVQKWSEITKINNATIRNRLYLGWPSEKILRLPPYEDYDSTSYLCWNIPPELERFNSYKHGIHKELPDTRKAAKEYMYIEDSYNEKTDNNLNKHFNRLTTVKYLGRDCTGIPFYLCECKCGNLARVRLPKLKNGHTTSCGCRLRENSITHGLSYSPLYNIHHYMLDRCYNPKCSEYKNYGAKGIRVCDDWYNDINGMENFYNWAMENGYQKGMTVFLLDQSKPFGPDSCILLNNSLIRNFRRDAKYLTVGKYTYPLGIWLLITGHKLDTIRDRLAKGWSDEDTIMTAPRGNPGVDKIDLIVPEEYFGMNCYGKINRSTDYILENDGRIKSITT